MRHFFGVGDFGLSALGSAMQFYLLFYYTDVVKIDPAVAGTAMLVAKLAWDMPNDLLTGWLSDRLNTRWGRRRPFLMFCALPLFLSYWLLFSLPVGMGNLVAFFAVVGSFCLFDTFLSLVTNAYYAMTAELTDDYDERTRLSTVRMVYNCSGYILGAAITTMLALWLHDGLGVDTRGAWSLVGLIFGALGMITILITGLCVTLKPVVTPQALDAPIIRSMLSVFRNKPFVKYATTQALMSCAFTFITTMLPYYLIYQLDMEKQISYVMLALLLTLTIFLVPCRILADRVGKAKAYAIGLFVACVALVPALFLGRGFAIGMYAIAVVAGIGFSSQWVCPHSMMPDVIEYDELETGVRREGLYYGTIGVVNKIAASFGVWLCGIGLKVSGYEDGVPQTATALLGIRLMFVVAPVALLLACLPILLRYPVTRAAHAEVVRQLQARRADPAAGQPDAVTPADVPSDAVTPAAGQPDAVTPADVPSDAVTPAAGQPDAVTPADVPAE